MKLAPWLLALAALGILVFAIWTWRRRVASLQRASEERLAALMATVKPPVAAPSPAAVAQDHVPAQRMLFEAAAKAGEAGEPALAIQLYARLLARYPDSPLAAGARHAVEALKKRLGKA